jgi:hypothetical protein
MNNTIDTKRNEMKDQTKLRPLATSRPVLSSRLDRIINDEMERRCSTGLFNRSSEIAKDPIVGRCIDTLHPVLSGRIQVCWETCGQAIEQWLPTLHGMTFRKNDKVLIQFPRNLDEPIVAGVVDGYAKRPDISRDCGPTLTLENDESIKILSNNGDRIIEVFQSTGGPVVKLCSNDTNIELPGKLTIRAEDIELTATQGSARISATDDVVVQGEEIRLN